MIERLADDAARTSHPRREKLRTAPSSWKNAHSKSAYAVPFGDDGD